MWAVSISTSKRPKHNYFRLQMFNHSHSLDWFGKAQHLYLLFSWYKVLRTSSVCLFLFHLSMHIEQAVKVKFLIFFLFHFHFFAAKWIYILYMWIVGKIVGIISYQWQQQGDLTTKIINFILFLDVLRNTETMETIEKNIFFREGERNTTQTHSHIS